jgi:hypothetical protein
LGFLLRDPQRQRRGGSWGFCFPKGSPYQGGDWREEEGTAPRRPINEYTQRKVAWGPRGSGRRR